MKRFILLLVIFLTTSNPFVYSQMEWDWMKMSNIEAITIGTDIGQYKKLDYKPSILWGVAVSAYGLYFDAGYTGSRYGHSTNIGQWDDSDVKYWHIGCTIPVSRYFTISPFYGVVTNNKLFVDGSDWWISKQSGEICNRTYTIDTKKYNDYGILLNTYFYPFGDFTSITIGCKVSKYQTTVNLGVSININRCKHY